MQSSHDILTWLLIFACLGSGMMAGLFVAFSTFMMKALGSLEPAEGMNAMQAINRDIVRPSFLLVFLGTAIALILSTYLAFELAAIRALVLTATAVYVLACIVSTIAFNIPLNNQLEAALPDEEGGRTVWKHYLVSWTNWNHVRSIACLVTTLLIALSLLKL